MQLAAGQALKLGPIDRPIQQPWHLHAKGADRSERRSRSRNCHGACPLRPGSHREFAFSRGCAERRDLSATPKPVDTRVTGEAFSDRSEERVQPMVPEQSGRVCRKTYVLANAPR